MEEVKQSRIHLDMAKRIVDKLGDGESHITKRAMLQVLKPLLEEHIAPAKFKKYKMPEDWFTLEMKENNDLLSELSSFLQRI